MRQRAPTGSISSLSRSALPSDVHTRYSSYCLIVTDPENGAALVTGGRLFLEPTPIRVEGATARRLGDQGGVDWCGFAPRDAESHESRHHLCGPGGQGRHAVTSREFASSASARAVTDHRAHFNASAIAMCLCRRACSNAVRPWSLRMVRSAPAASNAFSVSVSPSSSVAAYISGV